MTRLIVIVCLLAILIILGMGLIAGQWMSGVLIAFAMLVGAGVAIMLS